MNWLVLVILALVIFWALDKGQREKNKAIAKQRTIIKGEQITYTELASKRHNIHTALNMIKLGLVTIKSPDDEKLSYLYAGGIYLKDPRLHLLAHRYGLVPGGPNYVGD